MKRPFSRLFLECCPFSLIYYFVCYFQDLVPFKKYHDLPSTTSCEGAAVLFVRNSPEYRTPWTQSESNSATYRKRKFGTLWVLPFDNLKNKHDLKRAGVKKVSALVHVYTLIVFLRG
jgi:hypothetical protein